MENIKAIIFDMDGVLVDSEPIHAKAEADTCLEFGINFTETDWSPFRGKKLKEIFGYFCKEYGKDESLVSEMVKRKVEIYLERALKEIKMVPGVKEFLEKVKATQKYSYMLTTSGVRNQQIEILNKFGLTDFFPIMITAEDVEKGKPDPEPYLKSVARLGVPAENCLVFEDSYNGVVSAKAAGCQVCGVANQFFPKEKLEEAGADLVISDFKEIEKVLF